MQEESRAPVDYPHRVRVLFAGRMPLEARKPVRLTRAYFLLHYVTEGSGVVVQGGKEYRIKPGGGFFFFPGIYHEYVSAPKWAYHWVAFDGPDAQGLLRSMGGQPSTPVFSGRKQPALARDLDRLRESLGEKSADGLMRAHSLFFSALARIAPLFGAARGVPVAHRDDRVARILEYLRTHLHERIDMPRLATLVGLDPDHLAKRMKRITGYTPASHLRILRMDNAWNQLRTTRRPIGEIGASVGYPDPFTFSRAFRQHMGCSPTECRDGLRERPEWGTRWPGT